MKRFGKVWDAVCDIDNIRSAAKSGIKTTLSAKHKNNHSKRRKIIVAEALEWLNNFEDNVNRIQTSLILETYEFGELVSATIKEPKERKLDYPLHLDDRIYHNCLMNVLIPLLISKMTNDTYGSIKGRGIASLISKLHKAIEKHQDWYYIKTDFRHFYESINHDILKDRLRHIFKDTSVIKMCDKIIDCFNNGLAIGIFPDSYFANIFVNPLDHLLKEDLRVPFVFRYMDDIVCLVPDKKFAHRVLDFIIDWANKNKLDVKNNWRIAPVCVGINMCGYISYPTHIRLRKNIKQNMKKSVARWASSNEKMFKLKTASYYGWCCHADCKHLMRKVFKEKYVLFKSNDYGWTWIN